MSETETFFELMADCCTWSTEIASRAVTPAAGSLAFADLESHDQFLVPEMEPSVVDLLHDAVIVYLLSAIDFARALAALVAAPDVSVAAPGGALTRGCCEAAGYTCHLAASNASLRDRLGRMLHIRMDALNHLVADGPNPVSDRDVRDRLRLAATRLGFELGPKKNLDAYRIGKSEAVELALPIDADQPIARILRSYMSASVHSMSTATHRAFSLDRGTLGEPRPHLSRVEAQEHVYLWSGSLALAHAAEQVRRWTQHGSSPAFDALWRRLRVAVANI